jgi:prepilin-type N-terminal cleavage/methylation domain-containing protein
MPQRQTGFTLIEIAIVLVIIGLLLGGILKGQELITGAKVRNLISQQDGIKAAFYGFQDRYRALPGDYAAATTNINGAGGNGDGDGQIELAGSATTKEEYILAWDHLSHAGFINGSYTFATAESDTSTPKNPYSAYLRIIYDNVYGDPAAATKPTTRHNLKTGGQVPVAIIAEVDRKIDDGNPYGGAFQFSEFTTTGGTKPAAANCVTATTTPATWKITGEEPNCGGASIF